MQLFWRTSALVFLISLSIQSNSVADQAVLQDGSLLVGTIQQLDEGLLAVQTPYGDLTVPWEQVQGLSTAESVFLQLGDGIRLQGILNSVDGQQFLLGAETTETAINLTDVVRLTREEEAVEATPGSDGSAPAMGSEPATDSAAAPPLWTGRAEFGLNGQSGNKERIDVRLGIDLNRKTERKRVNLYLKGNYSETNSEKSANEVMAGTRLEWDFSERTYFFTKLDLEYDEFEDLDLRATVTAGLGHFFIKREKLELKGWVGAGYEYEKFTTDAEPLPTPTTTEEAVRQVLLEAFTDDQLSRTEDSAVVELGYTFRKDVKENFRFKHGLTYYPSLDDPGSEYRLAADTAFEFPLGKEPDWTLRTGLRHEYDAMPQDDIDKLDTTYYLNLGYNW